MWITNIPSLDGRQMTQQVTVCWEEGAGDSRSFAPKQPFTWTLSEFLCRPAALTPSSFMQKLFMHAVRERQWDFWTDEVKYWKSKDREQEFYLIWWCIKRNVLYFDEGILHASVTLTGTSLWIRTLPRRVGQRDVSRLPLFLPVYQQSTERNLSPYAKDVSAHYLVSLHPRGTKVTASNLTCRDGNLSDTLNNLLMQKLKGLSVSLGGGEESRALDNGADVQDAGLCPSAEGRQSAEEGRWQSAF